MIGKCRCGLCREANRLYYHSRNERACEIARAIEFCTKKNVQLGTKAVRQHGCLGITGKSCPYKSYLRVDSKGNLCGKCREGLISSVTLTSTSKVVRHLRELSKVGVGRRTVADLTGISSSILLQYLRGSIESISRTREAMILAIEPKPILQDNSLVPAEPTWRLFSKMIDLGCNWFEITERIGISPRYGFPLLMRDRVTAKNARRVAKAYRTLLEEQKLPDPRDTTCGDCGLSHTPACRLRILKRMLPCTLFEVTNAYPCIYAFEEHPTKGRMSPRMLFRDLHSLGAVPDHGLWAVPPAKQEVSLA